MDFFQQGTIVPSILQTLVRSGVWLLLLAILFVPLERLFPQRREKLFRPGFAIDVGYYFLNGLAVATLMSTPLALVAWLAHGWLPGGIATFVQELPLWQRGLLSMAIGEVGFYWGHRWSHEIPFLWRFHAIHHSAEHVDWLVTSRDHPLGIVFTRLCGFVPLTVLGLLDPLSDDPGAVVLTILIVGQVWAFFIHANVRWRFGPLEWLIATPAFHHWHHTNDGPTVVDKNYAPMLPWIDWIFGTLHLPARAMPVRYGTDSVVPVGLLRQLMGPLSGPTSVVRPHERRPD